MANPDAHPAHYLALSDLDSGFLKDAQYHYPDAQNATGSYRLWLSWDIRGTVQFISDIDQLQRDV